MIREQVIITSLIVTKPSQIIFFQVRLPRNSKKIIGIELGGRWRIGGGLVIIGDGGPKMVDAGTGGYSSRVEGKGFRRGGPFTFSRNAVLGEIRLQSCEKANLFYSGQVAWSGNMASGDFTANRYWFPQEFTHQPMSFEEQVIVDAESTIIQGVYKDLVGSGREVAMAAYLVNVYLWIEIEEPEERK